MARKLTTYGVADHPNREEMKALWLQGLRTSDILAWLKSKALPTVKPKTLEAYGRRYWTPLTNEVVLLTDEYETGSDDPDIEAAQDLISKVEESGLGTVKNIKISSKEFPTWKRDEGDDIAVSEVGSSHTRVVEIIPSVSVGLERCQKTDVTIDYQIVEGYVGKPEGWSLGVFLPDMQIGYFDNGNSLVTTHDESAIDIAHQLMAQAQELYGIDYVINAGDNLDLPAFSSHRSAPGYMRTTQSALNRAAEEAAIQRALAPDARIAWIEGNHEQRLTNFLVDKAPYLLGLTRANDNKPVNSVPYLCRFEEYDIEWISPYPDGEIWVNDHLRFEHGSAYSSTPGGTAAKQLKNGVSVGYGHIHRKEYLEETRHTANGPRTHFAGSPGCLCRIDSKVPSAKTGIDSHGTQSGTKTENWQNGIWFFWYQTEGKQLAKIDDVSIWGGWALYNGREYFATVDANGNKL
jgi:hypothetical protein